MLPQYPSTVSLLGTHFYTEGSSVQCGLLFHSRRQKGPRTKGERFTHWNPGPYFLALPLPRAHCVTSRSLVPSEPRMDISGRVSLGSQVQHRILGRPSFFSPNRSHLAVAGRSQTPLMGNSQPCLSTWFPIAIEGLHLSSLVIFSSLFQLEGSSPQPWLCLFTINHTHLI